MEPTNPYQSPSADVTAHPGHADYDQTNPFSPKGRFGRLSYLAWSVLLYIPIWIVSLIFSVNGSMNGTGTSPMQPAILVVGLMGIAYFISMILFTIRRLHDFNASGWWTLLLFIPLLLLPLAAPRPEPLASSLGLILVVMVAVISFVFWLVLLFRRGTQGGNHYGPERLTRGWERVLGFVGIVFMILAVIGIIAAIAIPAFNAAHTVH